jgi:hypothetical protein
MTQKPRILIDTNKHGIRREINLDSLWKASQKKKQRKSDRKNRYESK